MAEYDELNDERSQHKDERPMSDVYRVTLDTLSEQTGEPTPDDHLSNDEAAQKIAELRAEAGYDTSTDDLDEP